MLVVTDLSATRRAKQKPRQWGPLSSVASAARWHADWLGIPAPAFLLGAWAGVGRDRNIMTGKESTAATTVPGWAEGPDGLGIQMDRVNSYKYQWEDQYYTETEPVGTMLAVLEQDAVVSGTEYNIMHTSAGGTTGVRVSMIGQADGASVVARIAYGTAVTGSSAYTALDTRRVVVVTCSGTWSPALVYLDGALHESIAMAGFGAPTAPGFTVGANAAYAYSGWIGTLMWIDGHTLSADQVATLSEQPYALLQPNTPPIWVDFGGASGGATYAVSVSDGWDVGDSAGSTAVFNLSAADGVTGGDSSGGTAEFTTSLTDGLVLGDTGGLSLVLTVSASDGIETGDAASVAVSFSVSVVDGWEAGDGAGAAATLNIFVTDGSVLSEALSFYSGATLSITDGFKVGDSVSTAVEWLASLTDGIVVGDTGNGTAEYVLTVSDGAAIGDVLQAVAEMAVAVSDGVSLGDTGVVNLGDRVSGLARFVFRVGGLELRLVVPDKLRRLILPEDGGDLEH